LDAWGVCKIKRAPSDIYFRISESDFRKRLAEA